MPVKNKGTNERTNEQTKKHDECTSKRVLNKFNIDVYLLSPNSQKKKVILLLMEFEYLLLCKSKTWAIWKFTEKKRENHS